MEGTTALMLPPVVHVSDTQTINSALDIFGGRQVKFADLVEYNSRML